MNAYRSRIVYVTMRESLLLLVAALGSALFLAHGLFYDDGEAKTTTAGKFLALTLILYVLMRVVTIVALMRPPKLWEGLELCPECGQPLDDGTPQGIEAHRRIPLTPHPTEGEIIAAVALRKAIDDARRAAQIARGERGGAARIPGDVENAPAGFERLGLPPSLTVTPKLVNERRGPKGPA